MSKSNFNDFIERKKKEGTLFYTSMAGNKICHKCCFRRYKTDFCIRFVTKIQRVNQYNGGFHHIPCKECLLHKLSVADINYMIKRYKEKKC